jgi:hypothetical protein
MREAMLLPMATPLPTATLKPMAAILLQPTVRLPLHFCGYLLPPGCWRVGSVHRESHIEVSPIDAGDASDDSKLSGKCA